MTTVVMPDGTHVEMPENPSPQELAALEQMATPKAGAWETAKEIGRVADKSIRKGLAGMPGMIGDSVLATMRNMPRMPGAFGIPKLVEDLTDPKQEGPIHQTKFGDVTKAIETAGGAVPMSEPKTNLGKGAANVLEPVVAAMSSGGLANLGQRAAIGAGSGVGGEVAGRLTNDNQLARAGGSLLGGGVVGAVGAWRPNATELVQDSTKHMRDSDWQKAKVLEAILQKEGLPHLKSQILGPRSTLDDVVGAATANPSVRPKVITAIQGAPKAVEEMVNLKILGNLPPNVGNRTEALDDIQQAAQNSIRNLRTKSNQRFTDVMPKEGLEIPQERVKGLYDELIALSKSSKYGETSDAGKAIRRYAEDLVSKRTAQEAGANLDPVAVLRAKQRGIPLEQVSGPRGEDTLEFVTDAHKVNNLIKELSLKVTSNPDYRGLPVADVKKLMVRATPEFDAARGAKQAVIEAEVNPAKKSLVGQIAEMGGGVKPDKVTARDTALNLTFGSGPKATEIERLGAHIGGEGVGSLLREHISKTMQKVWPSDLKRTEQTIGAPAALGDVLAGAKWKRDNIDAALGVLAKSNGQDPKEVQKGFYHLIRALETYKDVKLAPGVSPAATAQIAGTNLPGAIAEPFGSARRLFGSHATTKTYDKLTDIILSPTGLAQLEALAKSPQPERLKALAIGVMTAADAQETEK